MRQLSNDCTKLSAPSYLNFGVSIFILFGILVSYLPQHYRIIARRSSEGISPYFVLLGTTSGTCAFANILTLSRTEVACCREVSGFECFAGLLGIAQVGVQWSCFCFILLLFLLFFPRATPLAPLSSKAPSYRLALLVTLICIVHLFVIIVVCVCVLYLAPEYLIRLAATLGVIGTILAAIQFLPQIYTTWRLQKVGSLSIPMMCIQTPGSFVWVASLAGRYGWEGWSTWGIYLVTGFLQGCLLIMAISFEIRGRRERKKPGTTANGVASGHVEGGTGIDERTRLLSNERDNT